MKVEQVFQLLEKGFTRDDIMKLTETENAKPAPQKQPEPQEQQKPQKKPEPQEQQKPQKQPEPQKQKEPQEQPAQKEEPEEQDQTSKRLDSIEQSIQKLVKSIQLQNLKTDSFGKAGETLEEQTDKIMASIIRPEP